MRTSSLILGSALLCVALALPAVPKTGPWTKQDATGPAIDAIETIKQAVDLIREVVEETEDPEASPRGGSQLTSPKEVKSSPNTESASNPSAKSKAPLKDIGKHEHHKLPKLAEAPKEDKNSASPAKKPAQPSDETGAGETYEEHAKESEKETAKGTAKTKEGQKPIDAQETKVEQPKPVKGIVEDRSEFDIPQDSFENKKDATTLLSDEEKRKQTEETQKKEVNGGLQEPAVSGTGEVNSEGSVPEAVEGVKEGSTGTFGDVEPVQKATKTAENTEAHGVSKREAVEEVAKDDSVEGAPNETASESGINQHDNSTLDTSAEKADETGSSNNSSGSPFNPINVIRGLARPVVNVVNSIRDGVGVAFAPVVDAITPGKDGLKTNATSDDVQAVEQETTEQVTQPETVITSDAAAGQNGPEANQVADTVNDVASQEPAQSSEPTASSVTPESPTPQPIAMEDASVSESQTPLPAAAGNGSQSGTGGSVPLNPIEVIRDLARPVINGVTVVRDQIGSALSPVVDAFIPGRDGHRKNETVADGKPGGQSESTDPAFYSEPETEQLYTK